MTTSIPQAALTDFFAALDRQETADWRMLDELLDRFPELARVRSPKGELPLRIAMRHTVLPGVFRQLAELGAEHDIFTACADSNLCEAERLLRGDGELVSSLDDEGNTPLHWACGSRFAPHPRDAASLVRMLLAAGARVDAENKYQETPLQRCVYWGDAETCELLLENGAEPDVLLGVATEDYDFLAELHAEDPRHFLWRDQRGGDTLLHTAIKFDCSPRMIEYLLAAGLQPFIDECNQRGYAPLLLAMNGKNFEAARILIERGADTNMRVPPKSPLRQSALMSAVCHDCTQLAEMLIARRADVHERCSRYGRTLLCFAESQEMVDLLVQAGLDPNDRDSHRRTPLDHALESGCVEAARALVRHGARADFFVHVLLGDREQVCGMLDHDPDLVHAYNQPKAVVERRPSGEDSIEIPSGSTHGTPLHYAVKSGLPSMVQLLLERGADVNARTEDMHWTPLHDATYFTIYEDQRYGESIIRMLISAGADCDARTCGGYRPIDIAAYLEFCDRSASVFDLLVELQRQSR